MATLYIPKDGSLKHVVDSARHSVERLRYLGLRDLMLARSTDEGLVWAASSTYEVVLVEVGEEGADALAKLTRILRERAALTGVIALTSMSDTHQNAMLLSIGADDYLPIHVDPVELWAKIANAARRVRKERKRSSFGELEYEWYTDRVYLRKHRLPVNEKAARILALLIEAQGEPVHRLKLVRDLNVNGERYVDTQVSRIRNRYLDGSRMWIEGVNSFGYRLVSRDR